ncbi:DUF202 domain-containing protein [Ancylobacter mangrovi]|uniref:DUF202 domain-containing protein n=1 Tax=Ancylobacter mangrovi TaxID=2972472 RepID=UPI002163724F|nr:DUF202 domain-containing protein [Ancylobacter mangrovi]MCS0501558.1 DUF202 domain-containing protein [Ancylobacter mangrovi]
MKDRGLQPERTALSWSRTGFLALLVTALLGRAGTSAADAIELALTLILAPMAGLFLYRGFSIPLAGHEERDDVAGRRRTMLFVGLGITAIAGLQALECCLRIAAMIGG